MTRSLKCEKVSNGWTNYSGRPKDFSQIRLRGQWLKAAGFAPNSRVTIELAAPGVLWIKAETTDQKGQ